MVHISFENYVPLCTYLLIGHSFGYIFQGICPNITDLLAAQGDSPKLLAGLRGKRQKMSK